MSTDITYTAITFAPVQGFIEKSRKLRDLYGSSYLLSLLAKIICDNAQWTSNCTVISPGNPDVTQGLPNSIVIKGYLPESQAKTCFNAAWKCIVMCCKQWLETYVTEDHCWERNWHQWINNAWEFFWVSHTVSSTVTTSEAIKQLRQKLNEHKRSRAWTGVNWCGESSSLSGADAIVISKMDTDQAPNNLQQLSRKQIKDFYELLSFKLGDQFIEVSRLQFNELKRSERAKEYGSAFLDPREQLNIPELVKRLITHRDVVENHLLPQLPKALISALRSENAAVVSDAITSDVVSNAITSDIQQLLDQLTGDLSPASFKDLNRLAKDNSDASQPLWTGWFMGDGDSAGSYMQTLSSDNALTQFSQQMRDWGKELKENSRRYLPGEGRMIYAGGDDFLGVLYDPNQPLPAIKCLNWFKTFKREIWNGIGREKPITPSVGFVWVSPQVPQRDVLQHCRAAEESAKHKGKDRIACRIVFGNGNYLEWVCPWWVLEDHKLLDDASDSLWNHFYADVCTLEARHAFDGNQCNIAKALFKTYFGTDNELLDDQQNWWNTYQPPSNGIEDVVDKGGLLGNRKNYLNPQGELNHHKINKALNEWVINLAKVGFRLCLTA
ncbi:MAG: CRISPR-associated protein [Acaryochloridaceae cyanobacterium CSU_3_4]|nr:CRISPR-associated protein [Acaryochloridaceae cyanobacterium CSU_3_4]